MDQSNQSYSFFIGALLLILSSCGDKKGNGEVVFEALDRKKTGLDFSNNLKSTPSFNMFKYMYFYNGAGAGAGDFNNDGKTDLFFSSNQGGNKIFINEGNLQFKEVTTAAGIPHDNAWSTGVSVADVNDDGMLDIYVCRVGNFESLQSRNQLLICQTIGKDGVPVYKDMAVQYGLDFSGFSTHAAFFDYDMDGDLDMYLLNHSLRFNGTFSNRATYAGTYDQLSGDRMYRNDSSKFTDVTRESGINSSIIGYGLGIAVADINLDGLPDLYIGNDFHENDYMYINLGNGKFSDTLLSSVMHTSQFSMGVDIADINNDAYPEVISMDMLPADPYILKRSLGEDEYNTFFYKIRNGYNYQYARNNLQLNRGNGMFSEIGLYAGIYATDWSWAPLWMDFDNDGQKDLFVSNGIPKRLNDMDYINYVSNDEVQEKIRLNTMEDRDMTLIDKFPQIKLRNKFFRNKGSGVFEDLDGGIKGDQPSYSNGSVYADFDNDGDLDIVVNNIDEPVVFYKNTANDNKLHPSVTLKIKQGPKHNRNAVGAKLIMFSGDSVRTYEKFPVHGFQSSMEIPLQAGIGSKLDSAWFIWPDKRYEKINALSTRPEVTYRTDLPLADYSVLREFRKNRLAKMEDITQGSGMDFLHIENPFNEFDREPLIPHMVSREGPGVAVADINNDGLDDIFIGSSKAVQAAVYMQSASGKFERMIQPAVAADSVYEDVDAIWADINKDGFKDLVVATGGNEYYGRDEHLQPRAYLNDGKGYLNRVSNAFDNVYLTASCVVAADFNGDGFVDLFVGGRAVPFEYGEIPRSYLLQNDGKGHFKDVTDIWSKDLGFAGFVTGAVWTDINRDNKKDLVICSEWGGIDAFVAVNGKFEKKSVTTKKGWWNFIYPMDVDADGDIDFVAGNLGLNSRLKASAEKPIRLYYNDFDGNGKKEQVLTYYLNEKEIPFANKAELDKQIPLLKKKYLYAEGFAKAELNDLFSADKLDKAVISTADYFSNALLINQGDFKFDLREMPWEAQLSSFRDATAIYANNDSLPDILLVGNYYENNIQMGRYDADFGTVLVNNGAGNFVCGALNGMSVKGQVRHIRPLTVAGRPGFILAKNADSARLVRIGF